MTDKDIALVNRFYMGPDEELDQWQVELIKAVMEVYPPDWPVEALSGTLRYKDGVLVLVPRQVGKTTIAGAIEFISFFKSIAVQGSRTNIGIVAQQTTNAKVLFDRFKQPFINNNALEARFKVTGYRGVYPRDKKLVAECKVHASDRPEKLQSIPFNSEGGVALTLDELHLQKLETYTALKLGIQAQRNTTMLMISTAGDENSHTLHILQQYGEEALLGQHPEFGYFRWYSPDQYDNFDPVGIKLANPAVACGRLSVAKVLDSNRMIPEYEFTRYILNRNGQSENVYLRASVFANAGGDEGIPEEDRQRCVIAVDRTSNWEYATLVAARKIDGVIHVELLAQIKDPTSPNLVRICKKLYKKYKCEFVMDAAMLKDVWTALREKERVPVEFYNTTQIANATSQTYALFADDRLVHVSDPIMVNQRKHAMTKALGEQYVLSVKDSTGDIDSIRAMVLAAHKAETTERNKPSVISVQ
ncbi:terminase large subunit [Rhodococcoides trifolii]|uniref:terminase large subunit n=1 Tax=Rhodococcoides trifolii TaxID=908250 RepID=UPI00166F5939|nr:terminase large subunit [Rhodococcus trifolii]